MLGFFWQLMVDMQRVEDQPNYTKVEIDRAAHDLDDNKDKFVSFICEVAKKKKQTSKEKNLKWSVDICSIFSLQQNHCVKIPQMA